MKAKELRRRLDPFLGREEDDYEVVISTQGIGGPCEIISSVGVGFDWYAGKIVLNTDRYLSTIDNEKYTHLFYLFLKKISNYEKVEKGRTLEAKYRSKTFVAVDKWKALDWLREQLNKELEKSDY